MSGGSGRAVGPGDVLALWDLAAGVTGPARLLAMAGADFGTRPVGRAHAELLRLRAALLGPVMPATTRCPGCAKQVSFDVDLEVVLAAEAAIVDTPAPAAVGAGVVRWRPPWPTDLAGVSDADALVRRCVLAVDPGEGGTPDSDEIRAALAPLAAEVDPLAELWISVVCPDCGEAFRSEVDPVEFVWAELDAAGRRLLAEVATLAGAFGWAEREILQLTDARRAAYLELVGA